VLCQSLQKVASNSRTHTSTTKCAARQRRGVGGSFGRTVRPPLGPAELLGLGLTIAGEWRPPSGWTDTGQFSGGLVLGRTRVATQGSKTNPKSPIVFVANILACVRFNYWIDNCKGLFLAASAQNHRHCRDCPGAIGAPDSTCFRRSTEPTDPRACFCGLQISGLIKVRSSCSMGIGENNSINVSCFFAEGVFFCGCHTKTGFSDG